MCQFSSRPAQAVHSELFKIRCDMSGRLPLRTQISTSLRPSFPGANAEVAFALIIGWFWRGSYFSMSK